MYHIAEKLGREIFKDVNIIPSIILIKGINESYSIYTGKIDVTEIINFIEDNMFSDVTNMTQESLTQILKPKGRKGVILYRSVKDKKAKQLESDFAKLAKVHKSAKFLFIVSDSQQGIEQRAAKHFGIDEAKIPYMLILEKIEEIVRYEYKGELTYEGMDNFINLFKEGKIARTLKSEDEPKDNPGPVYKVVGKTFKQIVIDNQMDIFVKFYAPWCGHCKELAPVYQELAKGLAANKNLKIVEIDATENEIPGIKIQAFPTLKLYAGNNKQSPIEYEEARSVDAMAAFLAKNCYNKIDIPKKSN